jgi:hypothetical protein
MPASAVGTTNVISSAAASTASVKRGRRMKVTVYQVRLMATRTHDHEVTVGVRPTTCRGQDA